MMFQDGGTAALGPLATDRPHQFKTQFIYQFAFGTSLGVNQYVASGLPVTREIGIYPTSNLPVQYLGRGSDGRTPMFSQTDLFVQHSFQHGRPSAPAVEPQRPEPVQPGHGRRQALDLPAGQRRRSPDEALFYTGRQTLESADHQPERREGSALPEDNGFQAPIRRASASSSRSKTRLVRLQSAPQALCLRGVFFSGGPIMRASIAIVLVLAGLAPTLATAQTRSDRERARIQNKLGWEDMKAEAWERAARSFQNAIDIDPQFEIPHYGLGRANMALKKFVAAIDAYERCRSLYRAQAGRVFTTRRKPSATAGIA